jgi:hypothetical protein
MRNSGLWVVVVGTAMDLLVRAFITATNLLELYREGWYQGAIKVAGVASTVAVCVVLVGFLMLALGSSATRGNTRT